MVCVVAVTASTVAEHRLPHLAVRSARFVYGACLPACGRCCGEAHFWRGVYVGVHVFVFNWFQMYLFRRYDFFGMYSFRIVYHLHWHILWGYARLRWFS